MDEADFSYSPPPPPQILTRTPLVPRRFPFPEEVPDFDEDDSSDSSRSLLRASRKDFLRKSIYDPLPNCNSNEPSLSASLLQCTNSRGGTKMASSGLYSSSLITSQIISKSSQPPQMANSIHFQLDNQKVSKILEESAKSKSFLIKSLFISILFLLLIVTALIGVCAIFWMQIHYHQCDLGREEVETMFPKKNPSPYEELLWQDVGQVGF